MEYSPSFADSLQADIKPSYSDSLMHGFDDKKFGLPKAKKYPMPDVAHVRSAIKFFNYVDRAHEKELAKAILARMHEYGIDPSDINVGDTNRFKKYLPQTELKHHGIKGMNWGVRRYQNANGSLISIGKKLTVNKSDTKITKRVKKDYNELSDDAFFNKYKASKKTYAKRVARSHTGDPYRDRLEKMRKYGNTLGRFL